MNHRNKETLNKETKERYKKIDQDLADSIQEWLERMGHTELTEAELLFFKFAFRSGVSSGLKASAEIIEDSR